jgi:serine/threonine-protein kinase
MTEVAAAHSKSAGAPDPLIGRVISDRFKVAALIARGGMGKVYRAEQSPLGRTCALKILDPHYAGDYDPEFHKRFFLEASIASKLTHPNTVTIFDYGRTDDDIYYIAMEYLEGRTLHRAIRDAGFLPEERAAHVARQVCRALREAHAVGVVHRDLKPANIFLVEHGDEADFVKVLDFGLVKNVSENKGEDLTQTGLFMGSPKYMAPEQIRGDSIDARTDIYGLGIILYEMITGKVPFDHPNSVNILMAHVSEAPPPMHQVNPAIRISPQLRDIVGRCMAKSPDERFRSMEEVLAALKSIGGTGLATSVGQQVAAGGPDASLAASGRRPVTAPSEDIGSDPTFVSTSGSDNSTPVRPASHSPADSAALPGPPFAVPPPRTYRAKRVAAMLGIGGVAMAGSFVLVHAAFRREAPTAKPIAASEPQARAMEYVTPRASAETTPPKVGPLQQLPPPATLSVVTDPPGARVREDGVDVCDSTPCEIAYEGLDVAKEHKLVLLRSGYRVETRTAKAAEGRVSVKLLPLPPTPHAPPALAPAAQKSEPLALPPGYKAEIPY